MRYLLITLFTLAMITPITAEEAVDQHMDTLLYHLGVTQFLLDISELPNDWERLTVSIYQITDGEVDGSIMQLSALKVMLNDPDTIRCTIMISEHGKHKVGTMAIESVRSKQEISPDTPLNGIQLPTAAIPANGNKVFLVQQTPLRREGDDLIMAQEKSGLAVAVTAEEIE